MEHPISATLHIVPEVAQAYGCQGHTAYSRRAWEQGVQYNPTQHEATE